MTATVQSIIDAFITGHADSIERVEWCKIEFSDVCSNGDVLINNVLDCIESHIDDHDTEKLEEDLHTTMQEFPVSIGAITCLINSLAGYENGDDPNPWWAS